MRRHSHQFTIVVEKDESGYFAYCPQLQGCCTQGKTYEEAMKNIEDAIRLHVEDREAEKDPWQESRLINVTSLTLAF